MDFFDACTLIKLKNIKFKAYKGKAYNNSDLTLSDDENSINYITRTKKNNGIKSKVMNENFEYIEEGNAITIGDTTATVFYQKSDFIVGDHMVVLRADWLNEYAGIFISLQLARESFRYPTHARAFTKDLVLETEVLIPLDDNGDVDLLKIENYIKKFNITKDNVINEIPDYFLNEGYTKACWYLDNINQIDFENKYASKFTNKIVSLDDRNWNDFKLIDFFIPVQSKGDIKTSEVVEGDIPLVSAVKGNNGIALYILTGDGVAEMFSAGCLTADMFGHVFYQPNNFYAVSHGRVNFLIPIFEINKYIGSFISIILEYQFKIRNSYSRMLTKELLEKCIIKLPVDNIGNPDWKFMEEYIKSQPFSCNI